jgi:hypothetical protein
MHTDFVRLFVQVLQNGGGMNGGGFEWTVELRSDLDGRMYTVEQGERLYCGC